MIKNTKALKKLIYMCMSLFIAGMGALYLTNYLFVPKPIFFSLIATGILFMSAAYFIPEKQQEKAESDLFSLE